MGFTGLIFVVIAVAWLVYLVPLFLNRRENGLLDEVEPGGPFTSTVTIVRRGTPLDAVEGGMAVVSTPLNRRAALRDLDRIDARSAARRRTFLAVLLVATIGVGGAVGFDALPWWSVLIPVGLTATFLAVARFAVRAMRTDLARRAARIRAAGEVVEETVGIKTLDDDPAAEGSIDLTAPIEVTSSLWDPVPITSPTYVQKPLAPRTVRTIDLSAPNLDAPGIPVTADARQTVAPEGPDEQDGPRVVSA